MEHGTPHGSETILLVDDDPGVRSVTARILEGLGYRVLQAGAPDEALQWAKDSTPHLLIMDVILPGMSGLALAHEIASLHPGVRVLFFSAYASEDMLKEQVEPGPGTGFLRKPFALGEIARTVREILDLPIPDAESSGTPAGGRESILVVHGDPETRRATVRYLERLGYHTFEAQFANRALTIAAHTHLDLVVVRATLPDMNGWTLAQTIHRSCPHVRFVVASGNAVEAEDGRTGVGEVPVHLIQEPFEPESLGRAVRAALDGVAAGGHG
jgi:CheY-like chemotaxis protein